MFTVGEEQVQEGGGGVQLGDPECELPHLVGLSSSSAPTPQTKQLQRAKGADRRGTRVREAQQLTSVHPPPSADKAAAARRGLELLESAGFWVDSGLSLPARAGYDVRADVMR